MMAEERQVRNPFAGTVMEDSWWLRRLAPGGRVLHLIDPESLISVCGHAPKHWQWPPEDRSLSICTKCRAYEQKLREYS